ncbi:MAG: RNA pseudouridine synthase [Clostridia bacterium]|nr:RNA pseudouridine synthase [Clostridia bacterium]
MEIVFKNKNTVVINKPSGVPTQPDPTGDADAMSLARAELSSRGELSDLWLVHRLDRGVGGLVAFARNKKSAAELSESVRERSMTKCYIAVVEGDVPGGVMEDLLIKDARTSKAYVVTRERAGVKRASLEYRTIGRVTTEVGERTLVHITLHTGRFHQIRVQFASRKHPLVGDAKYGSRDRGGRGIALFATSLDFTLFGERIAARALPDLDTYPWNLFDRSIYNEL